MIKKAILTLLLGLTAPVLAASFEHRINNQTNATIRVTTTLQFSSPISTIINSGQEAVIKISGWCTSKITVTELDAGNRPVGSVEQSFKYNDPKCESLTRTIDRDSTNRLRITTYRPLP